MAAFIDTQVGIALEPKRVYSKNKYVIYYKMTIVVVETHISFQN